MKQILIQTVLMLLVQTSYSQSCGTIISSSAIPANPTNADSNWINLQLYCNEGYYILNYSVTPSGNYFYIDAYYCAGPTQMITCTNDSIPLGILPAGNYLYEVAIYTANNSTGCSVFTITDQASGSWTVVDSTVSLGSMSEMRTPLIAPNPAADGVLSIDFAELSGNKEVKLFDLAGKLVFSTETSDTRLLLHLDVAPGYYQLMIESDEIKHQFNQRLLIAK